MRQLGRIVIRVMLIAVGLCTVPCLYVDAAVEHTPEAAGGTGAIYVAGNPNWYPIEYYDGDSESYEGILPEVLERISEKTGLHFVYIQAKEEDQRQRLARNGQVELVSGCSAEESWIGELDLRTSDSILSLDMEEGPVEVCLVFTEIAEDSLIRTVEEALVELAPQEILEISVQVLKTRNLGTNWRLVIVCAAAAAGLLILAVVQAMQLRRYKNAMKQDADRDMLTGIWNKAYFTKFFDQFISEQYRGLYCLIYIGFEIERVNQYYGEAAAEEQLCFAAHELCLSTGDNEVAARVSGGGFAVVRPGGGEQEVQKWTEALLKRLNRYMERYEKEYRPEFRAGIYMLQASDRDCETALLNARQEYQQAVRKDVDYGFARPEYLAQERERRLLKKQTLGAIQNQEFQMFLQFIVGGANGKICGAEAVSRWDHPQKGLLYPGSYIEIMEAEGSVVELDFYIFEEVCRKLAQWKAEGRTLLLSCNFSRLTIGKETFVRRLEEIAKRYIFDRSCLLLEITEDIMETDKETAFENVSRCKELGYQIALDDVGSGYTSFSDLRDYFIDVVKIDRSLLNTAVTRRGAALLQGVTALAHSLEMKVLCEGVETREQVELIREMGCDYIQGYYFYRPLPEKEADRVLREHERKM